MDMTGLQENYDIDLEWTADEGAIPFLEGSSDPLPPPDPQGQTIRGALKSLGHSTIAAVRQGKFFDIEIAPGAAREQAQREMDQIARDVLANPVIEDYSIEFSD